MGIPRRPGDPGRWSTRVVTANTPRIPMTTTTTTVCALATASEPRMLSNVMASTSDYGEELRPPSTTVGEDLPGVAAERDRDHPGDDRVHGQEQPADDASHVPVAVTAGDVLEQTAGRREPCAHLGEGVTLEPGNDAGDHERDPDRGTRHLTSRAEQREDPRADHGAHPDEGRLAGGQHLPSTPSLCGHARSIQPCRQVDITPTGWSPRGRRRSPVPGEVPGSSPLVAFRIR